MIWIYILAILLAQAIVVVLLFQFIDRRNSATEEKKEELPESADGNMSAGGGEASEVPADEDNVVGLSTYNVNDLKKLVTDIIAPIMKDCIEAAIEMKDVQFEESKTAREPASARMTPEQEARAFDDNRDREEILDTEDNTVAAPNTFASGADFDTLAKAQMILQSDGVPTPEEHKIVVDMYHSVEGTEFCARLPKALLEKLYECHRRAEAHDEAFQKDEPTDCEAVDRIDREKASSCNAEKPEPEDSAKTDVAPSVKKETLEPESTRQSSRKPFSMAEIRNKLKNKDQQ